MNRKQFIKSHGASCANWNWSWSFVNHDKKFVIFGVWDYRESEESILMLEESWQISDKGRKQPGYAQAMEHLKLIEEDGYQLRIFILIHSDENKDKNGKGPAKMAGFIRNLHSRALEKRGTAWFAIHKKVECDLAEEIVDPKSYVEGASTIISVNSYERNSIARSKCIDHFGYKCCVCAFDFYDVYGDLGKEFIHVHHVKPLSEIRAEYIVDPIQDLRPVCPNCHAMLHKKQPVLTIDELKMHLRSLK